MLEPGVERDVLDAGLAQHLDDEVGAVPVGGGRGHSRKLWGGPGPHLLTVFDRSAASHRFGT
jgi:hypothetical protein